MDLSKLFEKNIDFSILSLLSQVSSGAHLREIAELSDLSPRGASLILEGLEKEELLTSKNRGNKKIFSLAKLDNSSRMLLETITLLKRKNFLEERAKQISKNSAAKLAWIDETLEGLRHARSSTKTS